MDSQSLHDQQPHTQTATGQGKQQGWAGDQGREKGVMKIRLQEGLAGSWPTRWRDERGQGEGMGRRGPFQGNGLGNGNVDKWEHPDSSS